MITACYLDMSLLKDLNTEVSTILNSESGGYLLNALQETTREFQAGLDIQYVPPIHNGEWGVVDIVDAVANVKLINYDKQIHDNLMSCVLSILTSDIMDKVSTMGVEGVDQLFRNGQYGIDVNCRYAHLDQLLTAQLTAEVNNQAYHIAYFNIFSKFFRDVFSVTSYRQNLYEGLMRFITNVMVYPEVQQQVTVLTGVYLGNSNIIMYLSNKAKNYGQDNWRNIQENPSGNIAP